MACCPLNAAVVQTGESIMVADFSTSDYERPHQEVCSALVVPIAYQKKLAGLIHLHSLAPGHFDSGTLEIVQTLAVQSAIAWQNNKRYQEQITQNETLNRRTVMLSKLFGTALALTVDQPLEQSLQTLAHILQETTPYQNVVISLIDPETKLENRVAGAGMSAGFVNVLKTIIRHGNSFRRHCGRSIRSERLFHSRRAGDTCCRREGQNPSVAVRKNPAMQA